MPTITSLCSYTPLFMSCPSVLYILACAVADITHPLALGLALVVPFSWNGNALLTFLRYFYQISPSLC